MLRCFHGNGASWQILKFLFFVFAYQSGNGIFFNGRKLNPSQAYELRRDERIAFSGPASNHVYKLVGPDVDEAACRKIVSFSDVAASSENEGYRVKDENQTSGSSNVVRRLPDASAGNMGTKDSKKFHNTEITEILVNKARSNCNEVILLSSSSDSEDERPIDKTVAAVSGKSNEMKVTLEDVISQNTADGVPKPDSDADNSISDQQRNIESAVDEFEKAENGPRCKQEPEFHSSSHSVDEESSKTGQRVNCDVPGTKETNDQVQFVPRFEHKKLVDGNVGATNVNNVVDMAKESTMMDKVDNGAADDNMETEDSPSTQEDETDFFPKLSQAFWDDSKFKLCTSPAGSEDSLPDLKVTEPSTSNDSKQHSGMIKNVNEVQPRSDSEHLSSWLCTKLSGAKKAQLISPLPISKISRKRRQQSEDLTNHSRASSSDREEKRRNSFESVSAKERKYQDTKIARKKKGPSLKKKLLEQFNYRVPFSGSGSDVRKPVTDDNVRIMCHVPKPSAKKEVGDPEMSKKPFTPDPSHPPLFKIPKKVGSSSTVKRLPTSSSSRSNFLTEEIEVKPKKKVEKSNTATKKIRVEILAEKNETDKCNNSRSEKEQKIEANLDDHPRSPQVCH